MLNTIHIFCFCNILYLIWYFYKKYQPKWNCTIEIKLQFNNNMALTSLIILNVLNIFTVNKVAVLMTIWFIFLKLGLIYTCTFVLDTRCEETTLSYPFRMIISVFYAALMLQIHHSYANLDIFYRMRRWYIFNAHAVVCITNTFYPNEYTLFSWFVLMMPLRQSDTIEGKNKVKCICKKYRIADTATSYLNVR